MPSRFYFVPRDMDLIPDLSPTHHVKEKNKIGHNSLGKSVISPRKSEEVSDQSETQWVCPRQDWC